MLYLILRIIKLFWDKFGYCILIFSLMWRIVIWYDLMIKISLLFLFAFFILFAKLFDFLILITSELLIKWISSFDRRRWIRKTPRDLKKLLWPLLKLAFRSSQSLTILLYLTPSPNNIFLLLKHILWQDA